jgi:hypothetical protein
MKVNSSLSTKRKRPKAVQNTLSASRPPVERVLVIDIGGRSVITNSRARIPVRRRGICGDVGRRATLR